MNEDVNAENPLEDADDGFGPGDPVFDALEEFLGPSRDDRAFDERLAAAMRFFEPAQSAGSHRGPPRRSYHDDRPRSRHAYHLVRRPFRRTLAAAHASGPDALPRTVVISADGLLKVQLEETPEGRLELHIDGPSDFDGLVDVQWEIDDEAFRLVTPLWAGPGRERASATYEIGAAVEEKIDLLPLGVCPTEGLTETIIRDVVGPDAYGDARRAWRAWVADGRGPEALCDLAEELLERYGG